jgi:acyl-coenzyme A thioesterase PaaI-like protein
VFERAFQDDYPEDFAHCYGCGRLNARGLRIRSAWEGDEAVCRFAPEPHHLAVPGFVYGGLLASLIDCHAMGTAAAATYRAEGRAPGSEPVLRFVTASLRVDYLRPTPLGPLEVRARAREVGPRKVIVDARVLAGGAECVRGEVVAVRMPATMTGGGKGAGSGPGSPARG